MIRQPSVQRRLFSRQVEIIFIKKSIVSSLLLFLFYHLEMRWKQRINVVNVFSATLTSFSDCSFHFKSNLWIILFSKKVKHKSKQQQRKKNWAATRPADKVSKWKESVLCSATCPFVCFAWLKATSTHTRRHVRKPTEKTDNQPSIDLSFQDKRQSLRKQLRPVEISIISSLSFSLSHFVLSDGDVSRRFSHFLLGFMSLFRYFHQVIQSTFEPIDVMNPSELMKCHVILTFGHLW